MEGSLKAGSGSIAIQGSAGGGGGGVGYFHGGMQELLILSWVTRC